MKNLKVKQIIKSNIFICLVLFVSSFGAYLSNLRYIGVTDTTTNERFANNFAKTGNLYLNEKVEFTNLLAEDDFPTQITNTYEVDGKFYSKYPPSLSILSYPFFKAAQIVGINNTNLIGKFIGAFITALSIPILYLALLKITRKKVSLLISIIYAFGSSAWGVSSQALWQHTYSQLISILVIYLLFSLFSVNDSTKTKIFKFEFNLYKLKLLSYFFIGFLLALNITVRPTNIIAAILIGILILFTKNWRFILYTIIGGLIPISLLVIYNLSAFGSVLSSGYGTESSWGWSASFLQGFVGLLISPSVGLLVFSPIFIFALIGAVKILINARNFKIEFSRQNIFLAFVLIFIFNWVIYSKWWAWHGDSWVYRMMMDGLPYLLAGFIFPFEKIFINLRTSKFKFVLVTLTLLFSIYTQFIGAFSYDYSWDSRYKVSWKNYDYLFNISKSRLLYYLENQKYYINLPHKSVYVLGDKFGDSIDFNGNNLNVTGDKEIIHAVFLSSGRSPFLSENKLNINTKYDGISLYVSDNFLNKKVRLKVVVDQKASDTNAQLQIRQIGAQNEIIKYRVNEEIITEFKSIQEIRIQNDEIPDKISISQIRFEVIE